jgi:hypothetical protein
MQTQETTRRNATEVVVPSELHHEPIGTVPALLPNAPLDLPAERFTQALDRREANRKALLRWITSNLQSGIDFGQLHVVGRDKCRMVADGRAHECLDPRHWSRASLLKPGAEKICGMMGLIPRFPNLSEYEIACLHGEDIKVVIIKCELHTSSGFIAAEGTGARRVEQDKGDINKSLKMALKSAHIDATLRVAGLSELFTQDIEDFGPDRVDPQKIATRYPGQASKNPSADAEEVEFCNGIPVVRTPPAPPSNQPEQTNQVAQGGVNQNGQARVSEKQFAFVMSLLRHVGMTKSELDHHCVETYGAMSDHISRKDASRLIDWLRNR